ncbi:MAG TPA: hypothetical protein VK783_10015 [Bacteroidia bacterium]|jgi:hypothetical protein|nr:hypothetical protein [Bacteroidia bacterium]
MSIQIFNIAKDNVINSYVGLGVSNYKNTLENVYPLINRFDAQRKFLDVKFYERLERDILKGCLMPPITVAFVEKDVKHASAKDLEEYVNRNISKGYILDGIQRLSTLFRASTKDTFDNKKEMFFNVIVADNKDKLLYRMITLNNGQKGMTPRHQIEILTQELFDFKGLRAKVQTEKEKSEHPQKDAFSFGDISRGYIAFLTANVHNENSKIIDEKMDQILVGRILDTDLNTYELQFNDIINFIDKVSVSPNVRGWLQVANNFIGFCVGIRKSHSYIFQLPIEDIQTAFENFEIAFKILNVSKINLGKYRRELSRYYIENAKSLFTQDVEFLAEKFSVETITE